jgi:hypothetical protein
MYENDRPYFSVALSTCVAHRSHGHPPTHTAGSLYPGAPYERKYMAVDILLAVLSAWRQPAPVVPRTDGTPSQFVAFPRGFFAPATVQVGRPLR